MQYKEYCAINHKSQNFIIIFKMHFFQQVYEHWNIEIAIYASIPNIYHFYDYTTSLFSRDLILGNPFLKDRELVLIFLRLKVQANWTSVGDAHCSNT